MTARVYPDINRLVDSDVSDHVYIKISEEVYKEIYTLIAFNVYYKDYEGMGEDRGVMII